MPIILHYSELHQCVPNNIPTTKICCIKRAKKKHGAPEQKENESKRSKKNEQADIREHEQYIKKIDSIFMR